MLRHGVGWRQIPKDSLGVSGITCWRTLREWTGAGMWSALHETALAQTRREDLLGLEEMSIDGSHVRALKGGTMSAPHRLTRDGPGPSIT